MYNSKKIEGCQLDCASYPSVMRRRYSIIFIRRQIVLVLQHPRKCQKESLPLQKVPSDYL
jgi:hypothetical protein